jgi:hypothetical protein
MLFLKPLTGSEDFQTGTVNKWIGPSGRIQPLEIETADSHIPRRDDNGQSVKSSRKGAVRAARLKLTLQAHSWIGKDSPLVTGTVMNDSSCVGQESGLTYSAWETYSSLV